MGSLRRTGSLLSKISHIVPLSLLSTSHVIVSSTLSSLRSEAASAVKLTLTALQSLNLFLHDLKWPDSTLSDHLKNRVRRICVDRFQEAAD